MGLLGRRVCKILGFGDSRKTLPPTFDCSPICRVDGALFLCILTNKTGPVNRIVALRGSLDRKPNETHGFPSVSGVLISAVISYCGCFCEREMCVSSKTERRG